MPLFDVQCMECDHRWEVSKAYEDTVDCPECKGKITTTLLGATRVNLNRLPMDNIHKSMTLPGSKKIKSFANDKRKGGKDTT